MCSGNADVTAPSHPWPERIHTSKSQVNTIKWLNDLEMGAMVCHLYQLILIAFAVGVVDSGWPINVDGAGASLNYDGLHVLIAAEGVQQNPFHRNRSECARFLAPFHNSLDLQRRPGTRVNG